MRYAIRTTPKKLFPEQPNSRSTEQFERIIGRYSSVEDAQAMARYTANSRQIPLSYYQIVDADDVSHVIVEAIPQPGAAYYVRPVK